MTNKPKNISASNRAKLLNLSRQSGQSFQQVVQVRGTAGKIVWTHDKAVIDTPADGAKELDKLGGGPPRTRMLKSILDMVDWGTSFYCYLGGFQSDDGYQHCPSGV